MRRSSSLESVISMVSVANENGGSEYMQESETCNSAAQLSTGNVSFNSKTEEEEHEEEDGKENSHEEEDAKQDSHEEDGEEDCQEEEDGSECSSNRREFSGLEPAHKELKACLGSVEDEGEEINSRLEILQALVPGGYAMDTVSLLELTACYIKFLVQVVHAEKWC